MTRRTYSRQARRRLGLNVRRLREEAELSVIQLAEAIEVTRGFIYELEKGNKTPSLPILEHLAEEFSMRLGKRVALSDLLEPPGGRTVKSRSNSEP